MDQQAIRKLKPDERLTRLMELAEERKRELQLIEQMLKEATAELQQAASSREMEDALRRQLEEAEAIRQRQPEEALDARVAEAAFTHAEEERKSLTDVAQMMAAMYQPASDARPEMQANETYSPFKQPGYESLWRQGEETKFKKHEDKKEERSPLLL